MATMDDIAKRLGVSKGTVSKALSGAADVSETMRKSVAETAVELGYTRVFRGGTSPRLCVFVENMEYRKSEDFGWDIITGFRKLAEPAGYQVDIQPLTQELQSSVSYDAYMMQKDYHGGFFLGLSLRDPWMPGFGICVTPTVLLDNHVKFNPTVTHVGTDNDEGMHMAVSRLKELGHTMIGYLSSDLESFVYQDRYNAFFRAMRANGLEVSDEMTGYAFHMSKCLERHFPRLRSLGCTAVICSHDLLAHMLLIHCGEVGIRVPEELSVVGFDDIPLCRYTSPPLTTVRQDRTQLGKCAFQALHGQMGQTPISTLLLHAELIERGSTGVAPISKVG